MTIADIRPLIALLLTLAPFALAAAPDTKRHWGSFTAVYHVVRSGLTIGEITLSLERPAADRYRYTAFTKPVGLARLFTNSTVEERSEGELTQNGIRPEHYSFEQTGERKRHVRMRFDWREGKARSEDTKHPWSMKIDEGLQDKFGHQLAVIRAFAEGKDTFDLRVADGASTDTYHFKLVGKERIRTPAGEFDTLKVQRATGNEPPNHTLWLAPSAGFLPVRIHRHDKKIKMELARVEGRPLEG